MSEFGEYLRKLRGNRSLREMERITGLSHTYLSSLEKGYDPRSGKERKPTPEAIKKISTALNEDYFKLLILAGYWSEEEAEYRKKVYEESKENLDKLNAQQEEWEFENFKTLHYMKLEEVLAPDFTNVYLDGALLDNDDKELLIKVARVLFENKQKNHPSEEELREKFKQSKEI